MHCKCAPEMQLQKDPLQPSTKEQIASLHYKKVHRKTNFEVLCTK